MKIKEAIRFLNDLHIFSLTLREIEVLLHVFEQGEVVGISSLCKAMRVTQAHLSELCRNLHRRGLLKVEKSLSKKSRKILSLTYEGKEIIREMYIEH